MNRTEPGLIIDSWADIAARLAGGRDLTDWARACGAFQRSRNIPDGNTLLRLALAYGSCGLSLRQAALWAAGEGLARLSDEALYKRLAKTGTWLGEIAAGLVDGSSQPSGRRLRVVDGTTITAPGADHPTWRLILDFDPEAQRLCGVSLMPASQGEKLTRCHAQPGDVVIADRGFARPEGLAAMRTQGADFLVRLGRRSVPLQTPEHEPIALDRLLQKAGPDGIDQSVLVIRRGAPPLAARMLARPLPPRIAERNRGKLRRAGQKEGYTPSDAAFVIAGHIVLLTSLSQDDICAGALFALYRLRWQIELAIKRMKSLGNLDSLPAKTKNLARAWLHANLIGILLSENFAAEVLDSPPSEPCRHAEAGLDLAPCR